MHLTKIRLKTIQMSIKMALDATPTKIIAIHVLNAVPFFNVISKIIMPFSRKELKDKVSLLEILRFEYKTSLQIYHLCKFDTNETCFSFEFYFMRQKIWLIISFIFTMMT